MQTKELCKFIKEREAIRVKKERGDAQPWTKDPILATYRFCNVHREHDRVSRWICDKWREPNAGLADLWFAMVVARLLNLPDSLAVVGLPLPWKPMKFAKILSERKAKGLKNFNGAYIVSTNGRAMDKVEYLTLRVLEPLWAARKHIRPTKGDTLEEFHMRLMKFDGMGSFMAAQVVADMKYVPPLLDAPDWQTFAAPGPGSRRGLNRVMERPVEQAWPGKSWHVALGELHMAVGALLPDLELHAQDLQNCLCEFDKYERVRLGEGTPKQLYHQRS